jgi:hypothetical protein
MSGKSYVIAVSLLTFCVLAPSSVDAAAINVFGTGVDASGVGLAEGSADPHYLVNGGTAYIAVNDGPPFDRWVANTSTSKWIQPTSPTLDNQPVGTYRYVTSFDLTGLDPASAQLTLRVAFDNVLDDILINGVSTGITSSQDLDWTPYFSITQGFVPGTNTLEFDVDNIGSSPNPTGFRTEISGTASVPEPSSLALVAAAGIGLLRRTKKSIA